MTGLLIGLIIVLVVPLFAATWRTSLLGLSAQGFLMGWIAFRHGFHLSAESLVELVDLVGLRAIAAPLFLYRVRRQQSVPYRNDVIPPNLLSWTFALGLVLVAFRIPDVLMPHEPGDTQMLLSVSTAALLLGLLVLSTRSGPFSQMIGLLRIENAIALFELASEPRDVRIGVRVAQTAILLGSVLFYRWYLVHLTADETAAPTTEGPAL